MPENTGSLNEILDRGLASAGIDIDPQANGQLLDFLNLLKKWNRVYNLTAVRNQDDMVGYHIIDSLALLASLPRRSMVPEINGQVSESEEEIISGDNMKTGEGVDMDPHRDSITADILDIGSGAGLPVFPLAIVRPDLHFLSVESNGKKTRFQQQVMLELGLQNVTVMQDRIESVTALVQQVTSRAFIAPASFLEIAAKHCIRGGSAVVMLGHADRLPENLPVPFQLESIRPVINPLVEGLRHIAVCLISD
ncbi:MAG: 16S rRNA (guanine(527)-N(7))-methyltransferase RsmG [Granulosicoccus sp.]